MPFSTFAMSAIFKQQETAEGALDAAQASLNQTARERIALPKDKHLKFQTTCSKGACIISRKISTVGKKCFLKAPTSVRVDEQLLMEQIVDIDSTKLDKFIEIAKNMGLIQYEFEKIQFEPPVFADVGVGAVVHFPLEQKKEGVKFTTASFFVTKQKTVTFTPTAAGHYSFKLHFGQDIDNNAVYFKWETIKPKSANVEVYTHECVAVFNNSHSLNITRTPLPNEVDKTAALVESIYPGISASTVNKLKSSTAVYDVDKYSFAVHDQTLYFLRKRFPARRYAKSTGSDQGTLNETDIETMEAHIRKCTWETVYLHWVYEALYTVSKSINKEEAKVNIALLGHDEVLISIAAMAARITANFKEMMVDIQDKRVNLGELISGYNADLGLGSAEYNTHPYFGYKLTQWLLSQVESNTKLIPFHEEYTPSRVEFRAQLVNVNAKFHRSAIKTTFTTDVLMRLKRKSYIDPWGLIFGKETLHAQLPAKLQAYSLSTAVTNAPWAKKGTMTDKEISVHLNHTYMAKFTYDAFRHRFHGSDPVVASAMLEKIASAPPKVKKSKKISAVNKASRADTRAKMQDVRGIQKRMILGAGMEAAYTWSQVG